MYKRLIGILLISSMVKSTKYPKINFFCSTNGTLLNNKLSSSWYSVVPKKISLHYYTLIHHDTINNYHLNYYNCLIRSF